MFIKLSTAGLALALASTPALALTKDETDTVSLIATMVWVKRECHAYEIDGLPIGLMAIANNLTTKREGVPALVADRGLVLQGLAVELGRSSVCDVLYRELLGPEGTLGRLARKDSIWFMRRKGGE